MEEFLKWCARFATWIALILTGKALKALRWLWFWGAVAICFTGWGMLIGIPMLIAYGLGTAAVGIGRGVLEAKRRADRLPPRR